MATFRSSVLVLLAVLSLARGGSCTGSVLWAVPHDRGQRAIAIDDGVRYDSTSAVPGTTGQKQKGPKS